VKGTLRVHCSPGIAESLVSDVVMEFLETNSAASAQLTVGEITADVMKHGVDVMISSRYLGHDQRLHRSLLERDLGPTPYVICASEKYFEKRGRPLTPQDLQQHNCVLHLTRKTNPGEWQFTTGGTDYTVMVAGTFCSDFESSARRAALRGIGIARLPKYKVARHLAAGKLISLFEGQVQSQRVIKVYYPRSKVVPVLTRAFLDVLDRNYKRTQA
jgi:DNA-binding transcriptional LysR family regulator